MLLASFTEVVNCEISSNDKYTQENRVLMKAD